MQKEHAQGPEFTDGSGPNRQALSYFAWVTKPMMSRQAAWLSGLGTRLVILWS